MNIANLKSFDRTHTGTHASPFSESGVFSRPYEVHPASEVGIFEEEPVSTNYLAGEYVVCLEHVHQIWTVFHKSHHLTSILNSLKNVHLMRRSLCMIDEQNVYVNQLLSHFLIKMSEIQKNHRSDKKVKFVISFNVQYQAYIIKHNKAYIIAYNHHGNYTAGADRIIFAQPAFKLWILSFTDQEVLAVVIWLFINHEASTLNHDRVTAVKIAEHIRTITTAFILMTPKIFVFIENYLLKKR